MSSIVAIPATPPNSSVTIAICFLVFCISFKSLFIFLLSGTIKGFLSISLIFSSGNSVASILYFNKSFIYNIPITLSSLSSYTGILEYPTETVSFSISLSKSFIFIIYVSFLGTIILETISSSKSKILIIILLSSSSNNPCFVPIYIFALISSSETCASVKFLDIPNNLRTTFVLNDNIITIGLNIIYIMFTSGTNIIAIFSGLIIAILLGISSPKISINIDNNIVIITTDV